MKQPKRIFMRHYGGFTLVEMAIVMLIVVLLLGGLVPTLSSQMDQKNVNETRKQLNDIQQALVGFALAKGRLPCPADGSAVPGEEATTGVGSALTCTLNKGVLPWATLGVSETDAWGRRFTYRVSQGTKNFADGADGTGAACSVTAGVSFQLCSDAALEVRSAATGGSVVASSIPAVVVSHGINGNGAFPSGGGNMIGAPIGDESENADDDNIFVSHDLSMNGYDDLVVWISPNVLFNRMVTAGKLP